MSSPAPDSFPPRIPPFDFPALAQSLQGLPGVGPATASALAKKGLRSWGDALFFFPLRYEDRRFITPIKELEAGRLAVTRGRVRKSGPWGRQGKYWRLVLSDETSQLTCIWFNFKKSVLQNYFPDQELILSGLPEMGSGGLAMLHPSIFSAVDDLREHPALGRWTPIYPEIAGLGRNKVLKILSHLLERALPALPDPLSEVLPPSVYPFSASRALTLAHHPESDFDPENPPAWQRVLAVNELFYLELGLALQRRRREQTPVRSLVSRTSILPKFIAALPFQFTPGQQSALAAIKQDLSGDKPMTRLLCGDVSSGKTVVAFAAACLAAEAGAQTAFMAPTEILAKQHQAGLRRYLEPLGLQAVLVTGSQSGVEGRESRQALEQAAVVVGTHALLSQKARFTDLGLVIIDEQHRFGVHQRLTLTAKGLSPHLLVLSATPIPRTLALAMAGHLDISELGSRPDNRPPVQTMVLNHSQRRQALTAIEESLNREERVYVICPLVEPSEMLEAQDAITTQRNLSRYFPKTSVGLLHGRQEAEVQEAALSRFRSGQTPLLVATTVVEVGVDVPEATLMVILGADRFGLSQLHQLRGRVGRGPKPGRCILVAGPQPNDLSWERLQILKDAHDGLTVAAADLSMRGPGQTLGARQSGLPPFRVADWARDKDLIPPLRALINQQLRKDPELRDPLWQALQKEAIRRWGRGLGLAEAG